MWAKKEISFSTLLTLVNKCKRKLSSDKEMLGIQYSFFFEDEILLCIVGRYNLHILIISYRDFV